MIAVEIGDVLGPATEIGGPVLGLVAAYRIIIHAWNRSDSSHVRSDELNKEMADRAIADLQRARAEWRETEQRWNERLTRVEGQYTEQQKLLAQLTADKAQWVLDRANWERERAALEARIKWLEGELVEQRKVITGEHPIVPDMPPTDEEGP